MIIWWSKLPTSSIKAMKSRAVQGSHVFELELYHVWKWNEQYMYTSYHDYHHDLMQYEDGRWCLWKVPWNTANCPLHLQNATFKSRSISFKQCIWMFWQQMVTTSTDKYLDLLFVKVFMSWEAWLSLYLSSYLIIYVFIIVFVVVFFLDLQLLKVYLS